GARIEDGGNANGGNIQRRPVGGRGMSILPHHRFNPGVSLAQVSFLLFLCYQFSFHGYPVDIFPFIIISFPRPLPPVILSPCNLFPAVPSPGHYSPTKSNDSKLQRGLCN